MEGHSITFVLPGEALFWEGALGSPCRARLAVSGGMAGGHFEFQVSRGAWAWNWKLETENWKLPLAFSHSEVVIGRGGSSGAVQRPARVAASKKLGGVYLRPFQARSTQAPPSEATPLQRTIYETSSGYKEFHAQTDSLLLLRISTYVCRRGRGY
jgi:hypothetical protein